MKDPNHYVRKRLYTRPRNLFRQSINFRPKPDQRTKTLHAFVAELPQLVFVKPRQPEIPTGVVEQLFRGSTWGDSLSGKLEILRLSMGALVSGFGDFVGRLFGKLAAAEVPGEEVWKTVTRAFAKDIGLDADEALAFIERGIDADEKTERLRALVASFDLGGREGAIALVFGDLSRAA